MLLVLSRPSVQVRRRRHRWRLSCVAAHIIVLLLVIGALGIAPARAAGFERAEKPRAFSFPRDHGAHPGFRAEWWYYTGALRDAGGRRFGFQLTFFRVAIVPELAGRASNWATRDVMFAHFTVTDVANNRFRYAEKAGRPVLGLAGFSSKTLDVFIDDWSARASGRDMLLKAAAGDFAIDLSVTPVRPPVPNGDNGLSRKGPGTGNANYYYSIPRLATRGTLKLGGRSLRVTGTTWMDHEWGTSELAPNQKGWDWFSLRLSDGRDLMIYVLRDAQGQPTSFSSGTLVDAGGRRTILRPADFSVRVRRTWTSPKTKGRYPSSWTVRLPRHGITLEIDPEMHAQELVTEGTAGVTYWEGLVRAKGTSGGRAVTGEGYVEMTGYAPRSRIGGTQPLR